jgi:hypothetical protein
VDPYTAAIKTLNLLSKVVPIMFASLILSNALFSLPQFGRVSDFMNKVVGLSNLKSGFAVASFLIHPVVGVATLSAMYKSGKLTFEETAYSTALSLLPRGFRVAVLFLAPVAVSILGVVGLYFVLLDLLSRVVIFIILILLARVTLGDGGDDDVTKSDYSFNLKEVLKVFLRTVAVLSVSTFFTFLIFQFGSSENAGLLILFSGAMSTTAGLSVAGTMIHSGMMDWRIAVFLVYISRIIHVFVESFRFSLPIFTSFFGVRTGLKLLAVHIVSNSLSIALAALLFSVLL